MKNLLVIFILLSVSIGVFGQEEENISKNENEVGQKLVRIWKEDSQKLLNLIVELRKFKLESNDTDIQKKYKKEQLAKKIIEINKKKKGITIELKKVKVEDVEEEKDVSIYGYEKMLIAVNSLHKKASGNSIATKKEIIAIMKKAKRAKKVKKKARLTKKQKTKNKN